MLLAAAIGLGVLLAASVFLVARGLGAIIRRRWREGLAAVAGLGLFVTYVVLFAPAAYLLSSADSGWSSFEATHRARLLAENISCLMNNSALGAPVGLVLTLVVVVRNRRASRTAG